MTEATIFAENANVLKHESLPAQQYLIRLHSPECAKTVLPGNFIHLSCGHDQYRLKRPFSVMRSSPSEGWIEVLYKVVGEGTKALSKVEVNDVLNSMGPIGNSFTLSSKTKQPVLLGGGVGIPPILFFAEQLKKQSDINSLVIMGSEVPFPFKVQPSKIILEGIPSNVIASMSLLDDLDIPSRLTSKQGYPGCFDGYIHELTKIWLDSLPKKNLSEIEIFACGPTAMLKAVAELSMEYSLPCQLSLEEHMACAVGGCAGCTVEVIDQSGQKQMKRVCVDGPVFKAESVFN